MADGTTRSSNNLAVKRSVIRVFGFGILSLGLYSLYWFYVTRKAVTAELGSGDNAGLQTIGLIVPILNFFITYWLFRDINKLRVKQNLPGIPVGAYLGTLIASAVLGWIPLIGMIIAIGALVVYGLVVSKLNEYWDRKTNGQATDAKVTGGEIAVVLVGLVLFVAVIALGAVAAIFGSNSDAELRNLEQIKY